MTNGSESSVDRLVERLGEIRTKAGELEALKAQLNNDFADQKYRPILESVAPTMTNESAAVAEIKNELSEAKKQVGTTVMRSLAGAGGGLILLLIFASALFNWLGGPTKSNEFHGGALISLVSALVIVTALAGLAFLLVAFVRSFTSFDEWWRQVEKVLQSGAFYFFAGLALILYAIHTTNAQEHPSLVFLIAMLGVAITLFGTGSQAAGALATAGSRLPSASEATTGIKPETPATASTNTDLSVDDPSALAETSIKSVQRAVEEGVAKGTEAEKAAALSGLVELAKRATDAAEKAKTAAAQPRTREGGTDWSPVKGNAAIAGGAAVLTIILGFGVVKLSPEIREVFGDYDQYGKVFIYACSSSEKRCNADERDKHRLDDYVLSAALDGGSPVHLIQHADRVELVLFGGDLRQNRYVVLKGGRKTSSNGVFLDSVDEFIPLVRLLHVMKPGDRPKESEVTLQSKQKEVTATPDDGVAFDCVKPGTRERCRLTYWPIKNYGRSKSVNYTLNFFARIDEPVTAAAPTDDDPR